MPRFSRWLESFVRLGHVVRGIIYLVPGVLAVRLALGPHGAAISQTDAIEAMGHQPFGLVFLIAMVIGLAGYASWGLIRAVLDPLRKGRSPRGLAKRFGFATSALAYTGFLVATLRYLMGSRQHIVKSYDWVADLIAKPLGSWLIGIIGVCWLAGGGVGEIVKGCRGSFAQDLDLEHRSAVERGWAMALGRFGIITRGVLFAIIGALLVGVALHVNPGHNEGLDDALLALSHQRFGRMLLFVVGLGLVAFGGFSAMCARWARIVVNKLELARGVR